MPAGTVSLFCRNHLIDVYCHMLLQLYSLLHRSWEAVCYIGHGKQFVTQVMGRFLTSLYVHSGCESTAACGV